MNSFLPIIKYSLFILLILILVILVMILLSLFLFNPITSSSYNDYTELVESQVIDKGWVPEFIPKSDKASHKNYSLSINWDTKQACYNY